MKRVLTLVYGTVSYLLFLAVFAYLVLFVEGMLVPRTIDAGPSAPLWTAILGNVGLLALFSVQHSVMARQGFKKRWTKIVPWSAERSTYVLAASLVLALVLWGWRPIPDVVWSVEHPAAAAVLEGVSWLGWGIVLLSTFLIDHFRLFGLKQVWAHMKGEELEPPEFQTPLLYRVVRHPLYLGFLLAFWSHPEMTWGHLLFAGVWTSWILLAIVLEERDLERFHGDAYREYRKRVPKLIPLPGRTAGDLEERVRAPGPADEPAGI